MAHPKRKTSTQRKNKRRNHYSLKQVNLSTCPLTGEQHLPHVAYTHQGKTYYRGHLILDAPTEK